MVTDGIECVWREKLRFVVPTVMEGMKEDQFIFHVYMPNGTLGCLCSTAPLLHFPCTPIIPSNTVACIMLPRIPNAFCMGTADKIRLIHTYRICYMYVFSSAAFVFGLLSRVSLFSVIFLMWFYFACFLAYRGVDRLLSHHQ
jgi:hypothetical protein